MPSSVHVGFNVLRHLHDKINTLHIFVVRAEFLYEFEDESDIFIAKQIVTETTAYLLSVEERHKTIDITSVLCTTEKILLLLNVKLDWKNVCYMIYNYPSFAPGLESLDAQSAPGMSYFSFKVRKCPIFKVLDLKRKRLSPLVF